MIFCRADRLYRYLGLSRHLDTAIRFLNQGGVAQLPMGRTEIDGDAVYVNRFDYETVEEAITEGHIRYIDVHVVLEGEEQIGVADVSSLQEIERKEEEDYIGFSGLFQSMCVLKPGNVLITFPEDAHSPKRQYKGPCRVKKAVIKVLTD